MKIGNVNLANPYILAPMAGVTDLPFRLLCKEQGAGLLCMEMISAKALQYKNKNTKALLAIHPDEYPVSLQLFGSDPKIMSEMAKMIEELPFQILDINMGCPVPKVVRNGEGSALMTRAVDAIYGRSVKNAFCAVRPPGHHASRSRASGFCYLNNAAIGALWAQKRWRAERVMVLDFDAHHGDGTEEILADRPGVRFLSLFQWPLFPHRRMEPTPSNAVLSPLPAGAGGEDIRNVVENVWLPEIDKFQPDLMILSAGFDAHCEERIAQLKAGEMDYACVTRLLVEASFAYCEGRLVSVLEGGYELRSLARSVFTHLQGLIRNPLPAETCKDPN